MFEKVLVANRGEIACRILRTCARLGTKTVAVFSDADTCAPHLALADEAIRIGAAPVRDSYLNLEALVGAVHASNADAVHPGYGLLSESPAFARAVADAGARFIGPSPEAMARLGDKVEARELARGAGLAPPPGTQGAVAVHQARAAAAGLGYPLLVKAAAGGGGIGMQLIRGEVELERALETAAARAKAAFGDDRVYLERYLELPRHIELQLVRDSSGRCAVLGERECTVQRRHQKIIEESPSPAHFLASADGEAGLEAQAARACRLLEACGYEGVATVEFVANRQGQLYFLEVNARLQVEHPITEMRTGLDLVELQLSIANGGFLAEEHLKPVFRGHAIEARVCAEDPDKNFMPQPGRIARLELPSGAGVRVDAGVQEGYEVTTHYDPLLLKVIAHADDRKTAIVRLDRALTELVLEIEGKRGPRCTNQAFLRRVLASSEFQRGEYDTGLSARLLEARG